MEKRFLREPGRTGSDHRSRHARAAERSPKVSSSEPRSTGMAERCRRNGLRKRPVRSAAGCGARSAGNRRIDSRRSWAPGATAFSGAARVAGAQAAVHSGDPCPECRRGKVYCLKEPATRVRFVGHAPVEATVFEMERLRCNACGQVFTGRRTGGGGSGKV